MINYIKGDIFTSPAQVIVNAVNTVGVMGKGIALEFKNRYPKMFETYKVMCEKRKFQIGKLMLFHEQDHQILLFPTKENWRNPSKLEYIEKGLNKFIQNYAQKNITSIAFPKLGCGNGELLWDDVRLLMEQYLRPLPIDIYIYLGTNNDDVPEHKQQKQMQEWLRENAKDMSFNALVDDVKNLSGILPYEFDCDGKKAFVTYNNGLNVTIDSAEYFTTENDFFEIWDYIRSHFIVLKNNSNKNYTIIYSLLSSLNYLTKIKMLDKSSNSMVDGYQLNSGLGRTYSFKENNL